MPSVAMPFVTTDVKLAAFFLTTKFPLLKLQYEVSDTQTGRLRAFFIFADSPELQTAKRDYYSGQATVNRIEYERARAKIFDHIMHGLPWEE